MAVRLRLGPPHEPAEFFAAVWLFRASGQAAARQGLWPAFWLLPSRGGWPPELDVLEQTGGDVVLQTAHFAKGGGPAEVGHKTTVEGATTAFHTYGALWTAQRIIWFIDGEQTAAAPTPPDMHGTMYLLLNLAVGGSFAGDPDPTTPWPAHFEIDYVRAYGLAETPDSESPRHAGPYQAGVRTGTEGRRARYARGATTGRRRTLFGHLHQGAPGLPADPGIRNRARSTAAVARPIGSPRPVLRNGTEAKVAKPWKSHSLCEKICSATAKSERTRGARRWSAPQA
uniref:Glycoside hydrolase family 16 protein n=1 Tax=Phenylobacterium glaciei TaxID=2803784 RepID=A0A974P6L4_9CAUL|nr:glycoside hydrolase family 16 protein [Phenylobacterium glaciei]